MKSDPGTDYRVEPLASNHDRSKFDCAVEPLNQYLRQQAGQDQRKHVAAPFLLIHAETGAVSGFYTLASTAVELGRLPAELAKRLPRYPLVPATLLGRLAVDVRHRGLRLGEFLLLDALWRALDASRQVASFAIVVDAKDENAVQFYLKFGFLALPDSHNRLLLPMETVASLLQK